VPFVKTLVYEVIVELHDSIQKLKASSDPKAMKKYLLNKDGRTNEELLALVCPECTSVDLKGHTKTEIIAELVDLLASRHKLLNRDVVLADVLARESTMSTGMAHGIALPHGKTEGVDEMVVAVGVKKAGIDFESLDGEKSKLFIMVASPKKYTGPHLQFLAAIGSILEDTATRETVINSATPEEAAGLLRNKR
jgi:mannitol/fructose-specific phosphotransferase system IIA component (Ntr-type)